MMAIGVWLVEKLVADIVHFPGTCFAQPRLWPRPQHLYDTAMANVKGKSERVCGVD